MDNRIIKSIPGIFSHPTRIINLTRYYLQKGKRSKFAAYLPFVLDIEPTTFCNFRCRMCHVAEPDFAHRHMSFDLFKKIIDDNAQLIKIHLQGMGEPLLCPHLFEMICYANKKRILVQTTTNGSMLNEQNVNKIIDARLASIGISIDGATAKTFESIRQCSDFGKVIEGAKRLVAAKHAARINTTIRAWTVVQKENAHEVESIVRLCKEVGFDCLVFQVFVSNWGKDEWETRNSQKRIAADAGIPEIQKAIDLAKSMNLSARIHTGDIYSRERPCAWPWYSAFVSAEGHVVPCCILGDSRTKNFGQLADKSMINIWNCKDYAAFREFHANYTIPSYCKGCYRQSESPNLSIA
jgi:pyrroloquinoline quinone biosynthesis protein E